MLRCISVLFLAILGFSAPAIADKNDIIEKPSWKKQSANTELSLTSVVWDKTQFVAVGHKGLILTSTDGESWKKRSSGTNEMLTNIVYADGLNPKLIAGGEGIVITSNNGVDWNTSMKDNKKSFLMTDMIWADNKVIGFTMGAPKVMISLNGTRWDDINTPSGLILAGSWSGKGFVGVGLMSSVYLSKDAQHWSKHSTGIPGVLTSITFANNKFIAVGPRGLIVSSPNGSEWVKASSGTDKGFVKVLWNGKLAVAVGGQLPFRISDMMAGKKSTSEATIAYSLDGIRWGVESFDEKHAFTSVAWSDQLKKFVAVGHGGLIYTGTFDGEEITIQKNKVEPEKVPSLKETPLAAQVLTTILMKKAFQIRRMKMVCKQDISLFCEDSADSQMPACILDNRNIVSLNCKKMLAEEFGEEPTKHSFTHLGFTFPAGSIVFRSVHDSSISQIIAKGSSAFKGATFKPGRFMFNGGIRPTEFNKRITIDGVIYKPPFIALTPQGQIQAGTPIHDVSFNGIMFKGGEPVELNNGQIVSGVILNDTVIDGKTYEALTHINFHYFTKPLAVSGYTPYEEWKNRPNFGQLMQEYLKRSGQ
ncbi:MAG: hypothetical protein Q9M14_03705 [Mariprofundaceae bacterium]|nr:hypothetical protein [Mariprofundaceae bacterium]